MIRTVSKCARSAFACAFVFASATAQGLVPHWSHTSGSESWVPRHVALGNDGCDVMAQVEGADLYRRILVYGQSTPVWQQSDDAVTLRQRVASAAHASVHAALRDQVLPTTPVSYQVVVRVHANDPAAFAPGAVPPLPYDATFTLAERTAGGDDFALLVTPDGRRIVAVVYDPFVGRDYASTLTPGTSAIPRRELALTGPVQLAQLSSDGRRLLAANSTRVCVTDLETGATLLDQILWQPPEHGADLSSDGTVAAVGTQATLSVWRIGASSPLAWSYTHPTGARCTDVAISTDGSTLAASFSQPETANTVSVTWFDLPASNAASAPVVRATRVATSGGTLPDRGAGLSISADARVTAVGLWGDDGGPAPEVVVFEEGAVPVVRTAQTPGSVQRLDLSPDGLRLAVASKSRHNTVWAGGGRIELYDVGPADVSYSGVPRRGQIVQIEAHGAPAHPAIAILATSLAASPVERPGLGTLFLDRTAIIGSVPLGTISAGGAASAPFTIPSSWPIGAPIFVQAMTLAPGTLTGSWIKFTVLP